MGNVFSSVTYISRGDIDGLSSREVGFTRSSNIVIDSQVTDTLATAKSLSKFISRDMCTNIRINGECPNIIDFLLMNNPEITDMHVTAPCLSKLLPQASYDDSSLPRSITTTILLDIDHGYCDESIIDAITKLSEYCVHNKTRCTMRFDGTIKSHDLLHYLCNVTDKNVDISFRECEIKSCKIGGEVEGIARAWAVRQESDMYSIRVERFLYSEKPVANVWLNGKRLTSVRTKKDINGELKALCSEMCKELERNDRKYYEDYEAYEDDEDRAEKRRKRDRDDDSRLWMMALRHSMNDHK